MIPSFFGDDLSSGDTIGNIGLVDNVNITAASEPATAQLFASGLMALAGLQGRQKVGA